MTGPNIQQPLTPIMDPSMSDLLNLFKKDLLINLNCHHVGIIQEFYPDDQTASVTIAYKKTIFEPDKVTGIYNPVLVNYPLISQMPVIVLGGGTASLTFPISPGDECLVLFNDRDIDNWFSSGQVGPVATPRLHSFTDGVALVGLRSLKSSLKTYSDEYATLQNGPMGVGVSAELVKIYNATTTLGQLLQNIITQISTLAETPAVPGNPINPAVATALAAIATQLSELLA